MYPYSLDMSSGERHFIRGAIDNLKPEGSAGRRAHSLLGRLWQQILGGRREGAYCAGTGRKLSLILHDTSRLSLQNVPQARL